MKKAMSLLLLVATIICEAKLVTISAPKTLGIKRAGKPYRLMITAYSGMPGTSTTNQLKKGPINTTGTGMATQKTIAHKIMVPDGKPLTIKVQAVNSRYLPLTIPIKYPENIITFGASPKGDFSIMNGTDTPMDYSFKK